MDKQNKIVMRLFQLNHKPYIRVILIYNGRGSGWIYNFKK
jgi:hypothetical protein